MTKEGVQRITPFLTSDLVVHSVINSRNMNHDPVDDDYGEGDDGESEWWWSDSGDCDGVIHGDNASDENDDDDAYEYERQFWRVGPKSIQLSVFCVMHSASK